METDQNDEKIRKLAKALDNAIEKRNIRELMSYFSEECEIKLPGVTLYGRGGLEKAIAWMFSYLKEIILVPVNIMIQDNVFFEEFIVQAKPGGNDIELKMSEVLEYDAGYKVKSIRLYFDRLELARAIPANFLDRMLINRVDRASLKGLL
jgi:hypothetical protein